MLHEITPEQAADAERQQFSQLCDAVRTTLARYPDTNPYALWLFLCRCDNVDLLGDEDFENALLICGPHRRRDLSTQKAALAAVVRETNAALQQDDCDMIVVRFCNAMRAGGLYDAHDELTDLGREALAE